MLPIPFMWSSTTSRDGLTLPVLPAEFTTSDASARDSSVWALAHFAAFRSDDVARSDSWTFRMAQTELASVLAAFPLIRDRSAILALTAWFHVLCQMDDYIEALNTTAALPVLHQSGALFTHAGVAADRATTEDPQMLYQSQLDFIAHLKALLPPHTLQDLWPAVADVWSAMEIEVRQRPCIGSLSLNDYLALRQRTIGMAPFFVIIRHTCVCDGPQEQMLHGVTLRLLTESIGVAIGLQNDIVGLDKDVKEQNPFNFVLLHQNLHDITFEAALRATICRHNVAVADAMAAWHAIAPHLRNHGLRTYIASLVGLASTHYSWATRVDRYRATVEVVRKDREEARDSLRR